MQPLWLQSENNKVKKYLIVFPLIFVRLILTGGLRARQVLELEIELADDLASINQIW